MKFSIVPILKRISAIPFAFISTAIGLIAITLADGASRNLYWDGDYGIFLIDMHNAARLEQSLGISSRFGWAHPGPLNYYFLTPFYLLTERGVQSLMLGTLVMNAICLFGAAAIVARLAGEALAGLFLLLFAYYLIVIVSPTAAWDVLVPFSTVMPWVLALCLACAVVVEGYRWTPLLVLVLCFLTQAHVSLWLPSAFLGFSSAILALLNRRPARSDILWLIAAATLGLILWLPPLLEWHNLALIFRHFMSAEGAAHSLPDAFRALAVLIGESVTGSVLSYSNNSAEEWYLVVGAVLMLSSLPATVMAVVQGNRFAVALGTLCIGAVCIYTFALTRFTGPIMPHSITFMPTLGPALLIFVASLFVPRSSSVVSVLVTAGCVVLIVLFWRPTAEKVTIAKTPNEVVKHLSAALSIEIHRHEQLATVFIDTSVWPAPVGAVAAAYRNGEAFRIEPFWSIIFGHRLPVSTTGPAIRFIPGEGGPILKIDGAMLD
jgi:hypothetical protein